MKMTLEEQRDVIQAAIDGKEIEVNDNTLGWITSLGGFNFVNCKYRVVEPPVEYVEFEHRDGRVYKLRNEWTDL